MRPSVYIETTIPSYYHDTRPALQAAIARTREWWEHERGMYECFTSPVVIDELSEGSYPNQKACLALVADLPLLRIVVRPES